MSVMALALLAVPSRALEVEFSARDVRRDILAVYDSRYEATPATTRIHRLAEMPLNWLGFKLVYVDVNAPLPDGEALQRYRGIVSWLVEPMAGRDTYLTWLDKATAAGLRLACFSELAPADTSELPAAALRIFERLGLRATDQYVGVTYKSKVVSSDASMIGFERPLDVSLSPYPVMLPMSPATQVYLSLSVPMEEGEAQSSVVTTNSGGGYVADGFAFFYDANSDRARWIINPFLFFKRALADEVFPIPDVTTLDGRRIYFSHIDGDGWNNISEIEGYREAHVTAADVIRREAIEPYPDLPVTAALIAGDTVLEIGGLKTAQVTASKLFALPQVEVASHTYSHPFNWSFFENYDRARELAMIDQVAKPAPSLMDSVRGLLYRVAGKAEISDTRSRYIAGSSDLPRGYLKEPFDLDKEVREALRVSESYAPADKKAAIYQWSGDTEPFEAAVRATRQAGVRNMNGGDTRLDAEYPSVFYVPPIARPVGRERQIYAGNSNENTYTNNWHGPFYGQLLLEETLKNTETPRRLKPFNLYYHMYSGEKPGALAAIKHILDLARASPVIPVKASTYAAIADDFFAVEMSQVDANSWRITNRGAMQTFRFDDADKLDINWARSKGVLGRNRTNGSLYVALDPAQSEALIALTARPEAGTISDRVGPHLVDSRWQISGLVPQGACGFKLSAEGFGAGDMLWETRPGRSFEVVMTRGNATLAVFTAMADAAGHLPLSLPPDAVAPVEIAFGCREAQP